jgi:hypothetical protein
LTLLIACSQPGMTRVGYSALELKNSGIVMACPIPISRSRCRARPAMVIDRQEKKAEPRTRNPADRITTTTPWTTDRTPAANALPVISAARCGT